MSNQSFDGAYTPLGVGGEQMSLYLHFFNARKVDNLFDNPALFKKVEKVFLIP